MVGLAEVDHGFLRPVGDPGLLLQLAFELTFRPAGIADEGADLESLHLVHRRLLGGEMGHVLEFAVALVEFAVVLGPTQGKEGEVLRAHRPAHEDGRPGELFAQFARENVLAQQVGDALADGAVEDVAEGAVLAAVLGEEKDAAEESRFAQARIGENEAALERLVSWSLRWHRRHGPRTAREMSFGQKLKVGNCEATVFTSGLMQELTDAIERGELAPGQVAEAAAALLDESIGHGEKAAFLSALSDRGETSGEIGAFAAAFLERAVAPPLDRGNVGKPLLDVCGTGGDKLNLFNISTAAVFVLAACDVAVVKHGNRGVTSPSGGADVLEALGIRIDLPPEDFGRCLAEVGAGFLFAPLYHPAFKAVAPVRKQLGEQGKRTLFNLLGPLLNPTRPAHQLIGVFDPAAGPDFARILPLLGRESAWVVHGRTENGAGMDEISTLGPTRVWKTGQPDPVESTIEPSSFGFSPATTEDLRGGDAVVNASILTAILEGRDRGPKRDIVALNAAAGLVVTGLAADLPEGLARAGDALDSGAALAVLARWRNFA